MTQRQRTNSLPDKDKQEILELLPQLNVRLKTSEQKRLHRLEYREGQESDVYLQEVMRLYTEHMLGVFEKADGPRRERGAGKGKIGGHREGTHR